MNRTFAKREKCELFTSFEAPLGPLNKVHQDSIDINKSRAHDPPQLYDIVHFEHKLSRLGFEPPQNVSYHGCIFFTYKPLLNVGLRPNNNPPLEQSTP